MNAGLPKVLFVDDEERILRSLRLLFRQHADVLTTTSGAEALEWVGRGDIDVVVSDQRMPTMTGVEVLRGVRERSPRTMRILLTGYADLSAIVASVNEGEVFRFVEKPWNAQHLIATVAQAAEVARASVEAETVAMSSGNVERVLVLDQSEDLFAAVRGVLEHGTEAMHARDLESALAHLAEHDTAAVVADLPQGGEIAEALKMLKRYSPRTQTIVIAHLADARMLIGLINQGQVFRVLPKPVSRELLRRGLGAALVRHRELLAAPQREHRHAVEEGAEPAAGGLSSRLIGYWRRIRERGAMRT